MKFLREVPSENLTDTLINELMAIGYTLIWKEASIEVWANIGGI